MLPPKLKYTPSYSSALSSRYTGSMGASCASKERVASNTRRCCAASPGLPSVLPRASLVTVARGGDVRRT